MSPSRGSSTREPRKNEIFQEIIKLEHTKASYKYWQEKTNNKYCYFHSNNRHKYQQCFNMINAIKKANKKKKYKVQALSSLTEPDPVDQGRSANHPAGLGVVNTMNEYVKGTTISENPYDNFNVEDMTNYNYETSQYSWLSNTKEIIASPHLPLL